MRRLPARLTVRRAVATAAAGLVLILLLAAESPRETRRRLVTLARFAPRPLAVRRLGGSGTAFDRRFFSFLENARRRLPSSAEGVAVYGAPPSDPYAFLASYHLAPLPVLFSPDRVPSGWVAAAYGPARPAGARVLAEWAEGALLEPSP